MKKHSRSILAAALSVILLLSSAITSFADEALFVGETIGDASEITESSVLFEDVQEISDLNEITEVEEVVAIEEESALSDPDSEVLSAKLLMEGQTDPSDVFKDMKEYFADLGCTNTKINAKTGLYTDIGSFWNMLAMKALGIPGNTGTDYNKVDYTALNAQVLSKFIIAMVNDGKDPHEYGVKDSDGNLTMNVIELLQSYYNSEDGGYGKPNAKGVKAGSIYNQPYIMYALAITDAEIGEKAGQFFESKANEDGIFNSFGLDMDTTSWAIQACELAGLEYPNKDKALAYMAEHVSDMNANTRGCYLNCLATLGMLKEEHITSLVNDAKIYNPSTKRFLYNGKDNASATQQAAIPVGEFYNGSMYRAYDDGYIAESELSTKKVYARIADAKGEKNTVDILKRTELSVASGASLVLDGVNTASSEVTLLDVFTEAVCAEKLGKDPSVADLEANKDYINEKLGAANTSYGLSLTKLYGYEDGSFGYYTDRETMAWSPVDPVTADGTEVFLFHYDYTAASYAVFDKAEYEGTTASPAVVTVKKMDYDANWNPVFNGVAATVYAKNDKTEKAFTCAADGTVTLKGLEAGTYDLTAYFGDASAYIVSPYAVLTVTDSKTSARKVYARIADAKGEKNTVDILKRTELSVASGASLVLDGVNTASSEVTLLDVFTEAVCAEKLGKDPSVADLEANKDYINEKLGAANTSYGLSLTKLYGYEDGSFGYYTDRETMAWSPADEVSADGTEVFLFHYDYTAASYAVFDKAEYEGTTASPAVVTVKKMDYDANWNPVFNGVAATVYAKNDKTEKAFTCAADGTVTLKGLEAGTYDLTAYFGDASAYIVSPYAVYKVTKADKPSPDNTGSGSGTVHETPDKTGKVGDPVTNGNWTRLSDGRWMYRTNALFRSTWGYIHNPYGSEGSQDAWFYFDRNGYMLTGWQHIVDTDGILRWYYLNPVSDGTLGACFLNGVTPDGYTVNENGAWTVDGVVQEEKATPQQLAAASYDYSSDESAVTGSISISLTAGVTTTEGKRVSFSGSKKFSFADYEGSTAFDLLSELCGEKDWGIEGSGSYVSAINGLSEFDAGEQSGWMYSVNGKYPEIPAGDYILKKGDKVVWRYVTSWVNTGM